MTVLAPAGRQHRGVSLYLPRQHGAWAMLAVPLLIGIAAGGPSPWHVPLAVAAVSGYLTVATAESWARARFRASHLASLGLYGAIAAVSGLVTAARFPPLVTALVVIVPATALSVEAGRTRKPRYLVQSLAQATQAVTLAPAAAWVGGASPTIAARAGLLAAMYLVGTVLVVRSVIRERGNPRFASISIGFHVACVAAAVAFLQPMSVALVALLAARSAIVPAVDRRRARANRRIRPIELGVVEIAMSVAAVSVIALFGL